MNGHQGRGAGRVNRHARPLQAQGKGDASRRHIHGAAGRGISVQVVVPLQAHKLAIVVRADAEEDASGAADHLVRSLAGAFQCLPGYLQHKAVLRVHRQRLARRNSEVLRVKEVNPLQETAPPCGRAVGAQGVGAQCLGNLHTFGRQRRHRITPVVQQLPEALRIGHAAGEAAAHADDGDWLGPCILGGGKFCLHVFERVECVL